MKRRAVKFALFLILVVGGAIVNVAVAWGDGIPIRLQRNAGSDPPFWLFAEFARLGWPAATVEGLDGFKPFWPGFAINTVFYAALLWLLFAAPFALRRRRRIKRGLCARCGYPWGAGAVCSECGTAIVRRTTVHGAPPPATPDPQSNVDHNA